jgi:hypothetical protein
MTGAASRDSERTGEQVCQRSANWIYQVKVLRRSSLCVVRSTEEQEFRAGREGGCCQKKLALVQRSWASLDCVIITYRRDLRRYARLFSRSYGLRIKERV